VTIDTSTAVALDALGDELKAATATPSADFDARLLAAITPAMQEIEKRSPATGFRYTLNVTNALQLRAKKWYLKGMMEIGQPNQPFASCWFEYEPQLGFVQGGTGSVGASLGLSTCAAICHVWAEIVRRYLANNYTVA
jgi:hypothetical protein